MRTRRAARVIAVIAAVFLAASAVGIIHPRTAAAMKDCCKKRCHHDATRSMRSCCCAIPAAPTPSSSAPEAKPLAATWVISALLPIDVAPLPVRPAESHAPPGCPLFLQRCTLVL